MNKHFGIFLSAGGIEHEVEGVTLDRDNELCEVAVADDPSELLLENPFNRLGKKTGKERPGANDQIPLWLAGDIYCYFKPMNGVDAATADQFGHTIVSTTLAECAAWRLAHALGGVYEEIVAGHVLRKFDDVDPDAPGAIARGLPGKTQSDEPFANVREQCLAAAFFDSLIGQQDRNKNNWLWHTPALQFRLIDHGFSFGRPGELTLMLRFTSWRWGHKEQQLSDSEIEALDRVLASDDLFGLRCFVDEDRCDAFEARATQMRRTGVLILDPPRGGVGAVRC